MVPSKTSLNWANLPPAPGRPVGALAAMSGFGQDEEEDECSEEEDFGLTWYVRGGDGMEW